MSQHLSISVKFIYCISMNVLITLCDNNHQNLNVSGSNQSLIIDKNIDSNSYYLYQNGLLVSNSTETNYKSNSRIRSCERNSDCYDYQKCCQEKCISKSIYSEASECKGL